MSDTSLNKIIQYGTAAARVAFVPAPAASSKVLYLWYDTDVAPNFYAWNGAAWVQLNAAAASGASTTSRFIVSTTEAGLPNSAVLTAGAGIAITGTTGTTIVRNTSTTQEYVLATTSTTTTPNSRVLTAGSGVTITFTTGQVIVSASGGGASTTANYLVTTTEAGLPNSHVLVAGANVTFTTSTTQLTINAAAGGSGAWSLIESRTVTTSPENFINLGAYSEVMVILNGVTVSSSGAIRRMRVSIDNGANYLAGATDYMSIDTAGAKTDKSSLDIDNGNNATAHYGWIMISGMNLAIPKPVQTAFPGTNTSQMATTTSAINALSILPHQNALNGGTLHVLGR